VVVGTGTLAADGKRVGVYYVGNLTDGTQFDARTSGTPFSFTIGAGEVVPGFNEGVRGMKVGGRRQLIIPPELGYGSQANGAIPGNSILIFAIDLASVQ
jgi:peptidylprolyl isomerase